MIAGEGKMFSPGNLRATFDNPQYERLISYYVGEKYTLRYTGGMVPGMASSLVFLSMQTRRALLDRGQPLGYIWTSLSCVP